jgi:hypothetical protein
MTLRLLATSVMLVVVCSAFDAVQAQQMPGAVEMAGRPLPAPELAVGTVSVRLVREQMGNNVPNHPVSLQVGERRLTATTDAQGRAQFADLPSGTTITVEATVDGEALRSEAFSLSGGSGVRVALVAGLEAAAAREQTAADEGARQPARPGVVVFGGETRVIFEFQNDNLHVFYLLDLVNGARTPIDTGEALVIELPSGATGAAALQGSSPLASVQGDRIRITGPFPPGTTPVQVGYRYPYRGARATWTQTWPAAIEQLFVAIEKVGDVEIASSQFATQQQANAGGTPFLMATGGRVNAGEPVTLHLSGLPYHSTLMRDVGVGLGVVILLIGLLAGVRGQSGRDHGTRLADRKEKLFAELVALEDHHRAGRVDQRRYAARRQSLVAELERAMSELDRAPAGGGEGVAA